MSAALLKHSQSKKKNASAQGSLKFREVSNSFWEGIYQERENPSEESYLLTYLLIHLVSQNKVCTFTCGCIMFSRSPNYAYIGKKGHRLQLYHQFLAIFLLVKML